MGSSSSYKYKVTDSNNWKYGVSDNDYAYLVDDSNDWKYLETIEELFETGSELVRNGGFDTDSIWARGSAWSINGGVAICDGSQVTFSTISQSNVMEIGKTYYFTCDLTVESGALILLAGDFTMNSTDSYEYEFTASATVLILYGNADFIGTIDNVSIKEVL